MNRAAIPAARGGTLRFFGGSWASLVQTQLRSSKRPSTSGGACEHPAAQLFAPADGFAVRLACTLWRLMKPEDFVRALKSQCRDAAVEDCLSNFASPPGRAPEADLVQIAKWFQSLSAADRSCLRLALQQVADATLFGVLCVVDGVRAIEDSEEKSDFVLTARRAGANSQISPNDTYLHDLFRTEP